MTLQSNWNGNSIGKSGNFYNDCWGYVDRIGNEYAIIGSPTKIHFIDITDPSNPILKNEFAGGSASIWRDMKTYDCYTYAVADEGQEGLLVFDMSALPNGPITQTTQDNSVFNQAHNLYIDVPNARLYIIDADTRSDGLIVYDLSQDPTKPTLLAGVDLPGGTIHDLFVKDNIAYCSSGYNGLYIYDFENPAVPVYKASTSSGGYNHSCWLTEDGTKLIYAEEVPIGLPMRILDITKMEDDDLEEISSFQDPLITTNSTKVTYHNPYIIDQYAIVSSYEDGVVIFDISNPTAPTRVAHYDTYSNSVYSGYNGCWGVYPYFPSGTIIASDGITGLYVLSTSLTLTTDCQNGRLDAFEQGVDRGGFCRSNCAYTGKCTDFDRDGFSAELDCDDYNPLIPATVGTTCNDGDSSTINDKIQADGCTCAGE